MENPCTKCGGKAAPGCGCSEWEKWKKETELKEWKKWQVECLNTFLKPKKTNFDILNEFVEKTFGFDLDKDTLNRTCIKNTQTDCPMRQGISMCQSCQYKNYWSLEYKEEK